MMAIKARPMPEFDDKMRMRFMAKFQMTADGCWDWQGYCHKQTGYGFFKIQGKQYSAHRVSYSLLSGYIPIDLTIDHLCSNRKCVNPSHMEIVTSGENVRRGQRHNHNARKTHCSNDHEFTEENTYIEKGTGRRRCRACHRLKEKLSRSLGKQRAVKIVGVCKNGHELTAENSKIDPRTSNRQCRMCSNKRTREWIRSHDRSI